MGEKFPDKSEPSVQPRKRTSKVSNQPTRKSSRNMPIVTYNELSPVASKKRSVDRKIKEKNSESCEVSVSEKIQSTQQCGICKVSFQTSSMLQSHMRITHVRVLYNCPLCEKPMYSQSKLRKHYKQNHV